MERKGCIADTTNELASIYDLIMGFPITRYLLATVMKRRSHVILPFLLIRVRVTLFLVCITQTIKYRTFELLGWYFQGLYSLLDPIEH